MQSNLSLPRDMRNEIFNYVFDAIDQERENLNTKNSKNIRKYVSDYLGVFTVNVSMTIDSLKILHLLKKMHNMLLFRENFLETPMLSLSHFRPPFAPLINDKMTNFFQQSFKLPIPPEIQNIQPPLQPSTPQQFQVQKIMAALKDRQNVNLKPHSGITSLRGELDNQIERAKDVREEAKRKSEAHQDRENDIKDRKNQISQNHERNQKQQLDSMNTISRY